MLTPSLRFAMLIGCVALLSSCTRGSSSAGSAADALPPIPAPADVAAPPPDVSRTPDGLASKVLARGTGTRHPRPNSRVTVHYTGWTTDGKMFDSSVARNEPSSFALDGVIPGWTEGVQMMVQGEKRRFWIPASLAYEGMPDKPQGMLVFDIELISIDS
jgi:peptidylprolyl isomerase